MGSQVYLQKCARLFVLGIVITIPMVFGAVHPLLSGLYTFLMLVGLGGWLLLNLSEHSVKNPSVWNVLPALILLYVVVQSLPLPPEIIEFISPYRAERVSMVNLLAGTDQKYITLSESGVSGIYKAMFFFGLLFYYSTVKKLLKTDAAFLSTLVLCMVAVGVFEALYGLFQFISPQVGILWLSIKGRAAHGTIIYKNQYASFMNMIWPLAVTSGLCFFLSARKRTTTRKAKARAAIGELAGTKIHAVLFLFAAGAMCLAVLFSLSRGGILAMVFAALLLTLLFPFSIRKKVVFISGFVLFVFSYGTMLGLDTVVSRFNSMGSSGAIRFDIYLSSLPMLIDHWLSGIGFGAYTLLSPVYLKGFPENLHFDRVHNEYLELVIELGVPMAALLFAWIVSGLVKITRRIAMTARSPQVDYNRILIGMSAFCGLLGFLLHGSVDFGWRLPANLVYSSTLLAIAVSCLEDYPDRKTNMKVEGISES